MEKGRNKQLVMKANSVQPPALHESEEGTSVSRKPSGVRAASKEQFEKAQRKTSKLHAGLFRRLAK
jgi:hypothetical protein